MIAKVSEVFRSIQGEGKYAGAAQVFVRFFECNMHCAWCDTPHSIGDTKQEYLTWTAEELLKKVDALYDGCHSVSITGGEPLMQANFLKVFCRALKKGGQRVYLDTNGTLPKELARIVKDVDIIAMDFKLPSSTKEKEFWKEHKDFLKIAVRKDVFIKAVVTLGTKEEELFRAVKLVAAIDPQISFYLQPSYLELKKGLVIQCAHWQKSCAKFLKDVRILPQMHKFLKLR